MTADAIALPVRARPTLTRVIIAASIGNAMEWFDFLVYGYFAVTISKVFFPSGDETASLLATFGTFSVSFLVRPIGAIVIGIPLSTGWLRLNGRRALLRGSLLFLIGLAAMALSPWYALAFVLLLIGGLGTAAFSNMQTTLILTEVPPATRSRVMGIVTMCIGTGPVGVMVIGILSGQVGPPVAILIMAGLGLCGLSLVWRKLITVQAGR